MIRRAQPEDLEVLLDVWFRASLAAHSFMDQDVLPEERRAIAAKYLSTAETWVYTQEERVVGFITLIGQLIGALFVDPAAQGQGVGRALVDHARTLRGALELDVFKANRHGRAFYDRYGFQLVEEHVHEETGQALLHLRLEDA